MDCCRQGADLSMKDLFGNERVELVIPERALTAKERRKFLFGQISTVPRGHAAPPGTGPAGETCKTCEHYTLRKWAKAYRKCGLMREHWTSGGRTDIRARDPACRLWKKAVPE